MPGYLVLGLSLLLAACSDGNKNHGPAAETAPVPEELPDFTPVDTWLEEFVAAEDAFPGASIVIVDKHQGVIHRGFFGNQTDERGVLLASTSKVPTVMLLLALDNDDANINFDINEPISSYRNVNA
jgi:CubicO group peptidase (beta-lactamase class C family)